jgi:hypothetical protein
MMGCATHFRKGIPQSWFWPALCGMLTFGLLSLPAQALLVTVDLGWDAPLANYNLQEGSVVQVIMFDSSTASNPGSSADDNFGDPGGSYAGDDIFAAPYTSGSTHIPDDPEAYNPLGVPDGHFIAYTAHIPPESSSWHNIIAQFEVLGTYDRLYIRVFGATDLGQQSYWASYWGLSTVQTNTGDIYTWFVDPINNVEADQKSYFHVIPEPGSLSLGLLGAMGLWAGRRRRRGLRNPGLIKT